jgi:hypothetical protein
MLNRVTFGRILVGGLLGVTLAAPAAAFDKLTFITFSGRVQVPGITLDAGTYQFRVINDTTSRNVLQVLSNDGHVVFAMFHTRPDTRMVLTEESSITFKETPVGVPPAAKSLFYGGEYRGYEFVYAKGEPIMTPTIAKQPEITYTPMPVAVMPEPLIEPGPVATIEPEPTPWPLEAEPLPGEIAVEPAGPALPATASPLPLAALSGLLLLMLGAGVRRIRTRFN